MIDVRCEGISKKYRIHASARAGGRFRAAWWPRRSEEFWAVRDVSFEVARGEMLGIIGHNGAGKSTILKLLSSITAPTAGTMTINGRLSALVEIGSGFHPDLTGRENVYLNGVILGMRRREITEKLDSIVDFAGVRHFIDVPVKWYSSGMYVRLGFSIAAHLDPDVLLLDEVLSVGDVAFQSRCFQRITDLKREGTTIVFISHDLGAVERLCDRALLMERGRVTAEGAPRDVIAAYERSVADLGGHRAPMSNKALMLASFNTDDGSGTEVSAFQTGGRLIVRLGYTAHDDVDDVVFEVAFYALDGRLQCQFTTESSGDTVCLAPGAGVVEFTCRELGLPPSVYSVEACARTRGAPPGAELDGPRHCGVLRVDPGKDVKGLFYVPHRWALHAVGGGDPAPGRRDGDAA